MIENIILSRLKFAYEKNINKIKIRYSVKALSFFKILKEEGFLYSFKKEGNILIGILNYNNQMGALLDFKTFSKISKPYFIKNKKIVSIIQKNQNTIYILQTSKGLISNRKILSSGLGGILISLIK